MLGLIYSHLLLLYSPASKGNIQSTQGGLIKMSLCYELLQRTGRPALSLADSSAGRFLTSLANGLTGYVARRPAGRPAEYLMTVG